MASGCSVQFGLYECCCAGLQKPKPKAKATTRTCAIRPQAPSAQVLIHNVQNAENHSRRPAAGSQRDRAHARARDSRLGAALAWSRLQNAGCWEAASAVGKGSVATGVSAPSASEPDSFELSNQQRKL